MIEYVTRPELAKLLGVSVDTIARHEAKGKIPVMRIGKSVRYHVPTVRDALSNPMARRGRPRR